MRQISAIRWAVIGVLAVLLWQTYTVHANYGGNWTALFCTGERNPLPPSLASGTYVFPNSAGYDGQFYRYISRDPLIQGDMRGYLDAPLLRYRRILVPALAWLLAFGQPSWTDAAYIVVILGFVFAGCYWCGLWFLAIPATLISMDRMTIDIAAAALAAGAVVYWNSGRLTLCYVCLAAGCLTRETGVLIVAAWVVALLLQKRWVPSAVFSTAILPSAGWAVYLQGRLPAAESIPRWLFHWDSGILGRIVDPVHYPFSQPLETFVRIVDALALTGMLITLVVAGAVLLQRKLYPPAVAAAFHLALFAIVNMRGFWDNVYGYSRPFSPMIVLAAFCLPIGRKLRLALFSGIALMDLRILLQLAPQLIS